MSARGLIIVCIRRSVGLPECRCSIADFVYSEYLTTVPAAFRTVTWQIAEDYAKADLLLRLPGYCPMPAFKEVVDVPLVVRHSRTPAHEVHHLKHTPAKCLATWPSHVQADPHNSVCIPITLAMQKDSFACSHDPRAVLPTQKFDAVTAKGQPRKSQFDQRFHPRWHKPPLDMEDGGAEGLQPCLPSGSQHHKQNWCSCLRMR